MHSRGMQAEDGTHVEREVREMCPFSLSLFDVIPGGGKDSGIIPPAVFPPWFLGPGTLLNVPPWLQV